MSSINSECVVLLTIKCYCNLTSLKIVVHNYIFSKIIKQTEEVHQNNINVTTAVKKSLDFSSTSIKICRLGAFLADHFRKQKFTSMGSKCVSVFQGSLLLNFRVHMFSFFSSQVVLPTY